MSASPTPAEGRGWAVVRGLLVLGLFAVGFAGWVWLMLFALLGTYGPDGREPGGWAPLGLTVLMACGALGALCTSPAVVRGRWPQGRAALAARRGARLAGGAGLLLAAGLTWTALRARGSLPLGSPGTMDLLLLGAAAATLVALGVGATLLPCSRRTRATVAAGTSVGALVLGGALVALQRSSCQRLRGDVLAVVARDWRADSSADRASGDVRLTTAVTLDECRTLERLGTERTLRLLGRPDSLGERKGDVAWQGWQVATLSESDGRLYVQTDGPRVRVVDASY